MEYLLRKFHGVNSLSLSLSKDALQCVSTQNLKFSRFVFVFLLFLGSFFVFGAGKASAVYPVAGWRKFLLTGLLCSFFIFLGGLAFASPAYGATYYVDKTCVTNGNGSYKSGGGCADVVGEEGPYNTLTNTPTGNIYLFAGGKTHNYNTNLNFTNANTEIGSYDLATGLRLTDGSNKAILNFSSGYGVATAVSTSGGNVLSNLEIIRGDITGTAVSHGYWVGSFTMSHVEVSGGLYGANIRPSSGTPSDVTIEDCTFENAGGIQSALQVKGLNSTTLATNVTILDTIIRDNSNVGGNFENINNLTMERVTSTGNKVGLSFKYITNFSITDSSGNNNGDGINTGSGIRFDSGCSNGIVRGCEASENSEDGFTFVDTVPSVAPQGIDLYTCKAHLNGDLDDTTIPSNAGDGFTVHSSANDINAYYSDFSLNHNSGAAVVGTSSGSLINCVLSGNGYDDGVEGFNGPYENRGGLAIQSTDNWTVKNSIISKNWPREIKLDTNSKSHFIGYNNNYYNTEGEDESFSLDGGATFSGSYSAFLAGLVIPALDNSSLYVDAKFISSSNFNLQSTSPAIDSGTDVSLTTDYAGNPIYGTPDIGAYEYQPPYTIGTTAVPQTGSVRIYSNGKYRALIASTTADTITPANFSVVPAGGGYYTASTSAFMDLNIDNWEMTGNKNKSWTATSSADGVGQTHATSTVFTIGDLTPDSYYTFKIDGSATTTAITGYGTTTCSPSIGDNTNIACLSDSSGIVQFTYSGGYSTHTFSLEKDITSPAGFTVSSPANNTVNSDSRPVLSWNASSDTESGIAKYKLYIDNALDSDNISNTATSQTPGQNLACGSHSWYVTAVDNNGNTTNSNTFNYTRDCNTIPIYLLNSQNNNNNTANTNNDNNSDTSPDDDASGDDSEGSDVSDNQENKTATQQNSVETPRRGVSTLEKLMSEAREIIAIKTNTLNNFIANGTDTTKTLGAGERAGVTASFKSAFGRNPATETDWQDVIKIANGRWPGQKNEKTEANASAAFKKIYQREPDKTNPHDNNAIAIISYGLRPASRNLNSEKKSIQFFKNIYGYAPKSAMAWDIVRAIAYSGAKR